MSNAVESFGFSVDPKEVVVLIDNTMFGSGKDGCLICNDRIIFREAFEDAVSYSFTDIEKIQADDNKIFVNGKKVMSFSMPDKKDIQVGFGLLNEWLSRRAKGSNPQPVSCPESSSAELTSVELTKEQTRALITFVAELAQRNPIERVYVRPHIPPKKLDAAISSYGNNIAPSDVVILVDDTLFGGAKEGLLLSADQLALKMTFESPRLFFWKFVESIAISKRELFVNGRKVGQLTQLSDKEIGKLISALNDGIQDARSALMTGGQQAQSGNVSELGAVPEVETAETAPAGEDSIIESSNSRLVAKHDDIQSMVEAVEAEQVASAALVLGTSEEMKGEVIPKESSAKAKLTGYVTSAIEQHKDKIIPFLKEKVGELSIAALQDDSNVERLAGYIYALLPAVVRLALKEQVFTQFVLENRDKILERILVGESQEEQSPIALTELDSELQNDQLDAAPVPKRRLADFASATKQQATPMNLDVYRTLLSELADGVKETEHQLRGVNASQKNTGEFRAALHKYRVLKLAHGVLNSTMRFAESIARQATECSSQETSIIRSDDAQFVYLAYAMAATRVLLVQEAGFNKEQELEVTGSLILLLIMPYMEQNIERPAKKTLKSVANPLDEISTSDQKKMFKEFMGEFQAWLFDKNFDALFYCLGFRLRELIAKKTNSEDADPPLQGITDKTLLESAVLTINEELEQLLIAYLESARI